MRMKIAIAPMEENSRQQNHGGLNQCGKGRGTRFCLTEKEEVQLVSWKIARFPAIQDTPERPFRTPKVQHPGGPGRVGLQPPQVR